MKRTIIAVVALGLAASACSVQDATAPSTTTTETPPLLVLTLTSTGLGEVQLGATAEAAIVALTPAVGAPDGDTGWIDGTDGIYGRCPGAIRVINWGSLALFFGPQVDDGLFAYSYGFDYTSAEAGVDPRGLALETAGGVGLGTNVADLSRAAPGVAIEGDPVIDVWTFDIDPAAQPHLRGQVSGPGPTDTVLFIETSTGCE